MDSSLPGAEKVHVNIEAVPTSTFEPPAVPTPPTMDSAQDSVINLSSHAPHSAAAGQSYSITTILMATAMLTIGFLIGGAGGYFYVALQQPPTLPPTQMWAVKAPVAQPDTTAASTTNPLNAVKTNPFE